MYEIDWKKKRHRKKEQIRVAFFVCVDGLSKYPGTVLEVELVEFAAKNELFNNDIENELIHMEP
jgi:hypothetical protein